MEVETIFINACITMFSIGIVTLSLINYKKTKNTKILFVSFAFFLFFIKGMLLSIVLFYHELESITNNKYFGLFDALLVFLLFISTLKR